jgi:hypothetical protein
MGRVHGRSRRRFPIMVIMSSETQAARGFMAVEPQDVGDCEPRRAAGRDELGGSMNTQDMDEGTGR